MLPLPYPTSRGRMWLWAAGPSNGIVIRRAVISQCICCVWKTKIINNSNGITANKAAFFLRGPGWLRAFADGGGPMVCEHLHRGRQEKKIFLKVLVQFLPSIISSRSQASCLSGFLFYGVSLTPAPSPPTDPAAHSAALGTHFFPERALFYFKNSLFHSYKE